MDRSLGSIHINIDYYYLWSISILYIRNIINQIAIKNLIIYQLIFLLHICSDLQAQVRIDTSKSVEELVTDFFIESDSLFIIENIEFNGSPLSIGIISNPSKEFIDRGIILTTGDVFGAIGPNTVRNLGTESFYRNDLSLERLVNAKTFDALSLSFDFYSITDSISFVFVFASEEYEEYVGKGVNDVFGFFISAYEEENQNLAVIPGTETPISVDNVNAHINSEWFIPNPLIRDYSGEISYERTSQLFQYDGFTRELYTGIKITPNKKYHLYMAIADVGDRFYDSAILLKAGSFKSCGKIDPNQEKELNFSLKKVFGTSLVDDSSWNKFSLPIKFEINSATLSGKETFKYLAQVHKIMASTNNIKLTISGYTDDTGSDDYNLKLSTQRALSVKNYLIGNGILAERIRVIGKGEVNSGDDNTSQARGNNRRVEFFFQVAD